MARQRWEMALQGWRQDQERLYWDRPGATVGDSVQTAIPSRRVYPPLTGAPRNWTDPIPVAVKREVGKSLV